MRGLEKFETAVFDEGNVASRQLELERVAVMRASEEHCLAPQRHAAFAGFENARDDVFGLRLVVGNGDVVWRMACAFCRPQNLAVLPRAFGHQRIGRIEHPLGRSVVIFERDHRRREAILSHVLVRKAQDVVDRRGTKRINRLRVVADNRDAVAAFAEVLQDLGLQHVRVLVFVDEDVIEFAANLCREPRVVHHRVPVEQQVVVVECLIRKLLLDVRAIKLVSCVSHSAHQGKSASSVSASGRCVLTRCE